MTDASETPEHDITFMRLAIAAAGEAAAAGDMPFGAVLARDAQLLYVARNEQNTSDDCTAHAELVLVRRAVAALGAESVRGATVYASGEPCAMCSGAMFWAGVSRIVFSATTEDIARALGGPSLPARCADVLRGAQPGVAIDGPWLQAEGAAALVRPA